MLPGPGGANIAGYTTQCPLFPQVPSSHTALEQVLLPHKTIILKYPTWNPYSTMDILQMSHCCVYNMVENFIPLHDITYFFISFHSISSSPRTVIYDYLLKVGLEFMEPVWIGMWGLAPAFLWQFSFPVRVLRSDVLLGMGFQFGEIRAEAAPELQYRLK